ncbi:PhoH family protein [Gudongella sp. DL1XJH-153]|uniref:PhoH family protein n=1 Tax=Gudongella sp. DL1XJH-153 TaxID=3409804 RepID=UPI003BB6DB78
MKELVGNLDSNIKSIEEKMDVKLRIKDNAITIYGSPKKIAMTQRLFENLNYIIQKQNRLEEQDLKYAIEFIKSGKEGSLKELLDDVLCITASGKSIKPKTFGQKRYIDSLRKHDIVFGIGPAGTGKTYLAMAMAVQAFKNREVNRIVLTRPAVEAGENLGFLPGDLQEKVDPYLRPIYDALFEILGVETYLKYFEKGLIEVAPLAYMRGRTLDSAYVILDEAQNTTNEQMKMFLTRLGFGSKAIITGDITQIDLIRGRESGLKTVMGILEDVKGIDFIRLTSADIVRHPLVQRIINAYEIHESKK